MLNSLFHVRSPRCATRNFPKVMTLPTDIVFSTPPSSFSSFGLKSVQYAFGLPAPGSGVVITSPAELTRRQSCDRDLIARFSNHVFGLTVKFRICGFQKRI